MKTLLLAVLLGATPALGQMKDLRTVNNLPVDLTPLDQWLAHPHGQRPLKHWKTIQILDFEGRVAVWPKVRLRVEGQEKVVLLAHAEQVQTLLSSLTNLTAQIAATSAWIERADAALDRAEANADYINNNTDATAYVPSQWYATVGAASRALEQMEAAHAQLCAQVPKFTRDLAMFTGKTYGQLEVWDCGQRPAR